MAEAHAKHTYRQRMETLIAETEKGLSLVAVVPLPAAPAPTASALADALAPVLRDRGYFECARPELLALIPESARMMLDIGCGAGRLGEALKARQLATVIGLEMDSEAAALARSRLDDVRVGDAEDLHLEFVPGMFDVIVCGDVLEHLRRPDELLRRVRPFLAPTGRLVASIPNVRHHSVIRGLLDGNWTYESAGLLDRDHVRFFTRRAIEALFQDAGFRITSLTVVPGPGHEEWEREGRPGRLRVGSLSIDGIPPEEVEEFYAYQYLVTAIPTQQEPTHVAASADPQRTQEPTLTKPPRALRILYLGDFGTSWRHEAETAHALEKLGHSVTRLHEYLMPSPEHVLRELNRGDYDCFLLYKGRIGARSGEQVFANTGEAICEVLRRTTVPAYTWYVDRAYHYAAEPSREAWISCVAPLCRVAFVAEQALTQTDWARWHLLREPVPAETVQKLHVADEERLGVAFIGQLYGERATELGPVSAAFPVSIVQGVYGAELSTAVRQHRIILGPRYPCVPGYWGNRLYVILGHGGFFLAPEIEGMRDEGFVPGVHYAALEGDPVEAIRYWLARPEERERIARAGQEFVLGLYTYDHQVRALARVIEETL